MADLDPSAARNPAPIESRILSDERMGSLIASFGNHNGKALLATLMQEGQDYNPGELHGLIRDLPGADGIYLGSSTNQYDYIIGSFEEPGLVKVTQTPDGPSVRLAEEGIQHAKPLAALLLDIADKHDTSLESIFGGNRTSKEFKSPYVRITIMESILTAPQGMTIQEIMRATGIGDPTITGQLINLSYAGLVDRQPWSQGDDDVKYRVGNVAYDRTIVGKQPSAWRTAALDYLLSHGEATLDQLLAASSEHFDQPQSDSKKRYKLAKAFHQLITKGVVEKVNTRQSGLDSEVLLNDDQLNFWTELLNTLENFRTGMPSTLELGHQLAKDIPQDPRFVARALTRLNETSPHMQDANYKDMGSVVLSILSASEHPLTIRAIRESASKTLGRNVSGWGVSKILGKFIEKEFVTENSDGKVKKFLFKAS